MNNIIIHNEEQFKTLSTLNDPSLFVVKYNSHTQLASCSNNKFYLAKKIVEDNCSKWIMITRNNYNKITDEYVKINADSRFTEYKILGYFVCAINDIHPIICSTEHNITIVSIKEGEIFSKSKKKLEKYIFLFEDYKNLQPQVVNTKFFTFLQDKIIGYNKRRNTQDVKYAVFDPELQTKSRMVATELIEPIEMKNFQMKPSISIYMEIIYDWTKSDLFNMKTDFLNYHKCQITNPTKLINYLDEKFLLLL